jgi:uncharacterized LabA/DUF88 family protein
LQGGPLRVCLLRAAVTPRHKDRYASRLADTSPQARKGMWAFPFHYDKDGFTKQKVIRGTANLPPQPSDMVPNLQQKGVDMRIGMDVAALAIKRLVERIILFSGDTDMIPAMKLARREGLQVFVVKLDPWPLKHTLVEDSDGVRVLKPVP